MEVHELIEISGVNLTAVGFTQHLVLTDSALRHQFADLRQGEKSALFRAVAKVACGGVQGGRHG
ncbi:MAG: hypothetical protein RLZZ596_2848 [Pseudomonadota bacterium]